jgi:DMSO/TMAO reductase YedYZ molybdopterin-dependent catalytic subunit
VPINRTAAQAKVVEAATDPSYRLSVEGNVTMPLSLSVEDLRAMSWREADLPIACVDGWSSTARWGGVALRDVLSAAGAPSGASCTVISLQGPTGYGMADVSDAHVADPDTLLALEINGEALHIDHGFPVRLIGPDRPGVLQTKWVTTVVVA